MSTRTSVPSNTGGSRRWRRSSRSPRTRCRPRAPRRRRRAPPTPRGAAVRAPSDSGCASGTAPLPFSVVTIGAPMRSATAIARRRPQRAAAEHDEGVFAAASAAAARLTAAGSATGRTPPPSSRSDPAAGRSSTSIGTPMCTGRGRSRLEDLQARANASGSPAGSETSDRLRRDRAHERPLVRQVVQRPERPPRSRECVSDEITSIGIESWNAPAIGVAAFGDAGAGDQHADAGLAGDPRVGVGHEPRALLVPGSDVADRG